MRRVKRWRDTPNLERAIETAGGQEAFNNAIGEMLATARGWRLVKLRGGVG